MPDIKNAGTTPYAGLKELLLKNEYSVFMVEGIIKTLTETHSHQSVIRDLVEVGEEVLKTMYPEIPGMPTSILERFRQALAEGRKLI